MIKICVGNQNKNITPYDLRRLVETLVKQKNAKFKTNDEITVNYIHDCDKTTIKLVPETTRISKYKQIEEILITIRKYYKTDFDIELL